MTTRKILPFLHEELAVKQKFREIAAGLIARSQDENNGDDDQTRLANELAGGLIYANLAEYLASHLLIVDLIYKGLPRLIDP